MGKINRKILIVQPHSDDVLFSASSILLDDKIYVEVLTVENDEKRIKEDKKLFDFLGVKFHHLTVEFKDESYYSYYKQFKKINLETIFEFLTNEFGEEKLVSIAENLLDFVNKKKKAGFEILAPLGISHPFHFFVHYILINEAKYFYREFPHSYKRRAKEQMDMVSKNFSILENEPYDDSMHDTKFSLAKLFYKSQSGLLFFEQGYIAKKLPEEFYELKTFPYENIIS